VVTGLSSAGNALQPTEEHDAGHARGAGDVGSRSRCGAVQRRSIRVALLSGSPRDEGIVEYGEGPVHLVSIIELLDGEIVKSDYYFADPFEPPESRARWASP
jgi:hypothetical protein